MSAEPLVVVSRRELAPHDCSDPWIVKTPWDAYTLPSEAQANALAREINAAVKSEVSKAVESETLRCAGIAKSSWNDSESMCNMKAHAFGISDAILWKPGGSKCPRDITESESIRISCDHFGHSRIVNGRCKKCGEKVVGSKEEGK